MATCYHCGSEIEFRYIGGSLRPIHIDGGWCSAGSDRSADCASSSFGKVESYLDPNALCPVCGASVFFYRSPYNGRVFFDDVGWPWPKHPCTDKYQGRDDQISRPAKSVYKFHFKSREGKPLDVYVAEQFLEQAEDLIIKLKGAERESRIVIAIDRATMTKQGVEIADVREAPSFVMAREKGPAREREVSFLCARLQSVVALAAREI